MFKTHNWIWFFFSWFQFSLPPQSFLLSFLSSNSPNLPTKIKGLSDGDTKPRIWERFISFDIVVEKYKCFFFNWKKKEVPLNMRVARVQRLV